MWISFHQSCSVTSSDLREMSVILYDLDVLDSTSDVLFAFYFFIADVLTSSCFVVLGYSTGLHPICGTGYTYLCSY